MAGVYMDRGWMAPTDQTIKLTASVNGTGFTQTQNGGATVVLWADLPGSRSTGMAQTGAGCWDETTAPGILQHACSVRLS